MTQIKSLFLFCFACFLLVGCSDKSSGKLEFSTVIDLKGSFWNVHEMLGQATQIYASRDYFIVRNNSVDNTKLLAIDLETKQNPIYFGATGAGPLELANAGPMVVDSVSVRIYDAGGSKLLNYQLDNFAHGSPAVDRIFRTKGRGGVISLASLSDSVYVVSGIFPEGRLCLINQDGEIISWVGDYPMPPDVSVEVPFHVLGIAYQSKICRKPGGSRVALAARYGGIVQIFDIDVFNGTAVEIKRINTFFPTFSTWDFDGTPNFRSTEDTKWGYLSVASSDKYIFALYSGKYQRQGESFNTSNQIHVFDWDGNPHCLINLDTDGSFIAVNKDKLFLLTSDPDNGYDIVEYKLLNL